MIANLAGADPNPVTPWSTGRNKTSIACSPTWLSRDPSNALDMPSPQEQSGPRLINNPGRLASVRPPQSSDTYLQCLVGISQANLLATPWVQTASRLTPCKLMLIRFKRAPELAAVKIALSVRSTPL